MTLRRAKALRLLGACLPVKAIFQQGANGYAGTQATYFNGSGSGYNNSAYLRVSAEGTQKSLLRFDVSSSTITGTNGEQLVKLLVENDSGVRQTTYDLIELGEAEA